MTWLITGLFNKVSSGASTLFSFAGSMWSGNQAPPPPPQMIQLAGGGQAPQPPPPPPQGPPPPPIAPCLSVKEGVAKGAAQQWEAQDGGHSIDRHGPELTDAELTTRLTHGVAPDGAWSPAPASTRFKSYEIWLATRSAAIDLILTAEGCTVDTPHPHGQSSVSKKIEWGQAIDEGFAGTAPITKHFQCPVCNTMYHDANNVNRCNANRPENGDHPCGVNYYKRQCPHRHPHADRHNKVVWQRQGNPIPNCAEGGCGLAMEQIGNLQAPRTWGKGKTYGNQDPVSDLTRTTTTLSWVAGAPGHWKVVQHFPLGVQWDNAPPKHYNTPSAADYDIDGTGEI